MTASEGVRRWDYIINGHGPFVLASDYAALEADRDGLRADAERYRWLKDQGIVKAHVMTSLFKGDTRILAQLYGSNTYVIKGSVSAIDAAIDSARAGGA